MHRVGGGIAALELHQQAQRSFAELSSEISQTQITNLQSQFSQFRTALAHFASTHRDKIAKRPVVAPGIPADVHVHRRRSSC
ncbi:hypothetical protein NEOLEDRAFT_1143101 [Neolentinus lepideus HHB14362 ss-1]|uniref:Uncharacterized protein n=1 Tax=Neolentinus lepideus HHB14362 ss-1 TaxID=1314782 RepID=A0A165MRH7_9AGAM|nr:hypothetical protein NEOLEDRAFT_1143101 [Neolentinus lepideus HHB14362 ss-1]